MTTLRASAADRAGQLQGRMREIQVRAPVGGWNTRDGIDAMPPADAVVLDNWIPGVASVDARKGYEDLAVSMAATLGGTWTDAAVETLATLETGGSEYMLAAFAGGLARVDTGTPTQVKINGTYTEDRWQWAQFADSAAPDTPKLIAVNGADAPWTWDGTTHAAWGATGTGLTLSDLAWVASHKNRIYCGEAGSRNFWYGALGAGAGTLTRYPLSGVRGLQGEILYMVTLTRDTGTGPDDFAVFVTSGGQAVVYAGHDPGGSTLEDWALVGVYEIPRPIATRRGSAAIFGDALIATELDYLILGEAIQAGGGAATLAPSKLTGAARMAAAAHGTKAGWEVARAPTEGLLLVNVPLEEGAQYEQHGLNLQTRAAFRFTGWHFHTFGTLRGRLYGGGDGAVYRCLSGRSDDASSTEQRIELRAQTAWNQFGAAQIKQFGGVRPVMRAQGEVTPGLALGVDWKDPAPVAKSSTGPAGATTLWGDTPATSTLWGDAGGASTFWSGGGAGAQTRSLAWRALGGRGNAASLAMAIDVKDQLISWYATDYRVAVVRGF